MVRILKELIDVGDENICIYRQIPDQRRLFQEFYPLNPRPNGREPTPELKDMQPLIETANSAGNIRGLNLEGFNRIRKFNRQLEISQKRLDELVAQGLLEEIRVSEGMPKEGATPYEHPQSIGIKAYFPTRKGLLAYYQR